MRSKVLLCVFLAALSVGACRKAPAPAAGNSGSTPAPAAGGPGGSGAPAAPAPPKPVPAVIPPVIARVNGEDVKKEDFDRIVHTMEARAGQPIPADRRDEIEKKGYDVPIPESIVHSAGDAVGVSQLVEGITGERLGTSEKLGSIRRSESLGEGGGNVTIG